MCGIQHKAKKKKQVPARRVRLPFGKTYGLKYENISDISRQQLFDALWGFGSLEKQAMFIVRHSQ